MEHPGTVRGDHRKPFLTVTPVRKVFRSFRRPLLSLVELSKKIVWIYDTCNFLQLLLLESRQPGWFSHFLWTILLENLNTMKYLGYPQYNTNTSVTIVPTNPGLMMIWSYLKTIFFVFSLWTISSPHSSPHLTIHIVKTVDLNWVPHSKSIISIQNLHLVFEITGWFSHLAQTATFASLTFSSTSTHHPFYH